MTAGKSEVQQKHKCFLAGSTLSRSRIFTAIANATGTTSFPVLVSPHGVEAHQIQGTPAFVLFAFHPGIERKANDCQF